MSATTHLIDVMTKDSKLHILAGLLTALAVGIPCVIEGGLFAGLWGCLAGIIAGGVKEWCDMTYGGRWDWRDFGFTCIGVAVAMAVILITHMLV